MKKSLLLLGAVLGCAIPSWALDASDLVGKQCGVIVTTTNLEIPHQGKLRYSCKVKAGSSSNQIILEDFLGAFDLPLTINGNSLQWNLNNTYKGKNNYSSFTSIKVYKRTFAKGTYTSIYGDGYLYDSEAYTVSNPTITSTAALKVTNGDLQFDFVDSGSDVDGFLLQFNTNYQNWAVMGGFELYFYNAEDKAVQTTNGATKNYNLDLNIDFSDDTFNINNIFDWGALYKNEHDYAAGYGQHERVLVEGTIDWATRTVSMPACYIGGGIVNGTILAQGTAYCYNSSGYRTGSYTSNYWEIEDQDDYTTFDLQFCSAYDRNLAHHNLMPVTGSIKLVDAQHMSEMDRPKSGLDIQTYVKVGLTLDNAGYYDSRKGDMADATSKIDITSEKLYDISHYALIDFDNLAVSDKVLNAKLKTNIYKAGVNHFVTSESFYIVPGKYLEIMDFDKSKATLMKSIAPATSGTSVDLALDLNNAPESADGWYTIFVVSDYDASIGLTEKVQQAIAVKEEFIHEGERTFWAHHEDGGDFHTAFALRAETYNAKRTIIDTDITHDVDIANQHFGWGKISTENTNDYIYVSGVIVPAEDIHELVEADHYELFIVPGAYTSVSGDSFANATLGHDKGVRIDNSKYYTSFVPGGASKVVALSGAADAKDEADANTLNEGLSYNLLVPAADVNATTNQLTLYLKTVYKDEKAPTFHALTALTRPTTGVSDELVDGNELIEVVNGKIVIAGSNGSAMVTTASGVTVYEGGDNTISVVPGVYVARCGKTVKKLIVK